MRSVEPLAPLRRRLALLLARCHALIGSIADPYRPELHYMRGPGPKCRARQQAALQD
ncbi:hypothetical protein IC762_16405 [Bradyrhizobium genosp. L]|uniref:hypothetical protein n=1 Tax=Bradyrhizobium genosp. L TaxID=83637 RepID=UPI0018A2F1EB|nr:hypothetical protein [Bradyrhizobium genosp. L]QPF87774.1 hypothetical protein IC762_16405 [Bradyrhizobium genosp. L]